MISTIAQGPRSATAALARGVGATSATLARGARAARSSVRRKLGYDDEFFNAQPNAFSVNANSGRKRANAKWNLNTNSYTGPALQAKGRQGPKFNSSIGSYSSISPNNGRNKRALKLNKPPNIKVTNSVKSMKAVMSNENATKNRMSNRMKKGVLRWAARSRIGAEWRPLSADTITNDPKEKKMLQSCIKRVNRYRKYMKQEGLISMKSNDYGRREREIMKYREEQRRLRERAAARRTLKREQAKRLRRNRMRNKKTLWKAKLRRWF